MKSCNNENMRKRIGILTWHYYSNFGSRLQSYGMQTMLSDLGYEPVIINYRNPEYFNYGLFDRVKNYIRFCLGKMCYRGNAYNGRFDFCDLMFEKELLNQTKLVMSKEKLTKITQNFSTIVFGSDQIWAPNVFNDVYFGEGMNCRKVSYAASIGLTSIPGVLREEYKTLLGKFVKISVREEDGRDLLKQICGIESNVVLDPTLMIDVKRYRSIEKKPANCTEEQFVFCYFLNRDHDYVHRIQNLMGGDNKCIYGVSLNPNDSSWMTDLTGIGPREFLWMINHAKMVITDSYHGTIFSLLFHKKFYTFERFKSDDPINQNSRIYQLEKWFMIGNRIIRTGVERIDDIPYDYQLFEKLLCDRRNESFSFLEEALKHDDFQS